MGNKSIVTEENFRIRLGKSLGWARTVRRSSGAAAPGTGQTVGSFRVSHCSMLFCILYDEESPATLPTMQAFGKSIKCLVFHDTMPTMSLWNSMERHSID